LFHCGVDGANEGERFVAVSIYSDGLANVPGMVPLDCLPSTTLQVENYRSWIMKNDVDSSHETERAKNIIMELIDQPGRCLRDAFDAVDLRQSNNLSSIKPPEMGDSICMLVNSAERMQQCIQELDDNKPTEIAFDLECYNKGKEQQMTCLIQIATNDGRTYIIDVLGGNQGEVWDKVHGLAKFFADSTIVKIGHGIRGLDIPSLQRDFGIFVVNAFDTYEAATVLDLEGKGLATICAHYGLQNSKLYDDLKRKYQATDWSRRPLTDPMILYGRYDVHYLINLRRLMMRDMVQQETTVDFSAALYQQTESTVSISSSLESVICKFKEEDEVDGEDISRHKSDPNFENDGNGNTSHQPGLHVTKQEFCNVKDLRMNAGLMKVIWKSQGNCLKFWSLKPEPPLKNKQFSSLAAQYRKEGKALTKSQLSLYYNLASWREEVAKGEETLAGMMCSLDYLARVAFHRPLTENGLRIINYAIPRFLMKHNRKYMAEMFSFVRDSLADDNVIENETYPVFEDIKKQLAKSRRIELEEQLAKKKMRELEEEVAKKKMTEIEEKLAKEKILELEEQLAKRKMMDLLSIQENETGTRANESIISNPMFWAVSCATISVVICSFIGDGKRRR
jgi:ribonuclease D